MTGTAAGITVADPSYGYYVEAYRALARVAGIDAERLWRALWLVRPGDVRERFAAAVDAMRLAAGMPSLGTHKVPASAPLVIECSHGAGRGTARMRPC